MRLDNPWWERFRRSTVPRVQRLAKRLSYLETLETRYALSSDWIGPIPDPFGETSLLDRQALVGELVVAVDSNIETNGIARSSPISLEQLIEILESAREEYAVDHSLGGDSQAIVATRLVHVMTDSTFESAQDQLEDLAGVKWVAPNYRYFGSIRDYIPTDPLFASQEHHSILRTPAAWEITIGRPEVVIAILDDGIERSHSDLATQLWSNIREIPGNQIDDDGNGYTDDVVGWDFVRSDNDPSPAYILDDHGTHVAGIAAASVGNGVGVAGVAGGSRIMPLRIAGADGGFTSLILANAFRYAIDNGARIANTSYNTDKFVGDTVFESGLEYYYQRGGLHFNSAGNSAEKNPARQSFDNTIVVANSRFDDTLSPTSNYGQGIDIVAPGTSILSTIFSNQFGYKSGTSMSSPMAAGVAALVWSQYPNWTRDQVAAVLLGTAKNIDANNESLVGMLGYGRIDALSAVSAQLKAPRVLSVDGLPKHGSTSLVTERIQSFEIRFDQVLDPSRANDPSFYWLIEAGRDELLGTEDDNRVTVWKQNQYKIGTNNLRFNLPNSLAVGRYRLIVSNNLINPFGTRLDGNSDAIAGDDYILDFAINEPLLAPISPLATSSLGAEFTDSIETTTDFREYPFTWKSNHTVEVVVEPLTPSVQLRLEWFDSERHIVKTSFASAPGKPVAFESLTVARNSDNYLRVSSIGNAAGRIRIQVIADGVIEVRDLATGLGNNSMSNTETLGLNELSTQRGGIVAHATVLGSLGRPDLILDFETPTIPNNLLLSSWTLDGSQDPAGRIQIATARGSGGNGRALSMDRRSTGLPTLNEATWIVNIESMANPVLSFSQVSTNDELDPLPDSFLGRAFGDGVAVSGDGFRWFSVSNASPSTIWTRSSVELRNLASQRGFQIGSQFYIRFQQLDDSSSPIDGRAFDDIKIDSTDEDWYRFELHATDGLEIKSSTDESVLLDFSLRRADGSVIAPRSSRVDPQSQGSLHQYRIPTDGVYYLRVTGSTTNYLLGVLSNASFEWEKNESPNQATYLDLGNSLGVFGYLEGGDWFTFDQVRIGDRVWISTESIGSEIEPTQPLNPRIQLYADEGNIRVDSTIQPDERNEIILISQANSGGRYYLRVTPEHLSRGFYFIRIQSQPSTSTFFPALLQENSPSGSLAGTFDTKAETNGNGYRYELIPGMGSDHNNLFRLSDNRLLTAATLDYESRSSYSIRVRISDQFGVLSEQVHAIAIQNISETQVMNRFVFYNRALSAKFGDGSGNPTASIDHSKKALLPGEIATFDNYTNYDRGLNGLLVDVAGPGQIDPSDWVFDTWNGIDSNGFARTTAYSTFSRFENYSPASRVRYKIEFEDNAIANTWLRVTIKANDRNDLATDEVFYFGHATADFGIGNVGNPVIVRVTASDTAYLRRPESQSFSIDSVDIQNIFDLNKDGRVNATDATIVRRNQRAAIIALIQAPTR